MRWQRIEQTSPMTYPPRKSCNAWDLTRPTQGDGSVGDRFDPLAKPIDLPFGCLLQRPLGYPPRGGSLRVGMLRAVDLAVILLGLLIDRQHRPMAIGEHLPTCEFSQSNDSDANVLPGRNCENPIACTAQDRPCRIAKTSPIGRTSKLLAMVGHGVPETLAVVVATEHPKGHCILLGPKELAFELPLCLGGRIVRRLDARDPSQRLRIDFEPIDRPFDAILRRTVRVRLVQGMLWRRSRSGSVGNKIASENSSPRQSTNAPSVPIWTA